MNMFLKRERIIAAIRSVRFGVSQKTKGGKQWQAGQESLIRRPSTERSFQGPLLTISLFYSRRDSDRRTL